MSTMTLSEWCAAMRALCEDTAQRLGARVWVTWSGPPGQDAELDIKVWRDVERPRLEVSEGTPDGAMGLVWIGVRPALDADRDADLLARGDALRRAVVIRPAALRSIRASVGAT